MTEIHNHEDFLNVTRGKETLILLTAPAWCIPCRRFHPHWEMAQNQMKTVQFIEVDMGATQEDTSQHWAYQEYDVRSVPTVLAVSRLELGTTHNTRIQARTVVPFVKEAEEFFKNVR